MIPKKEIKKLQKCFRCLHGWKIKYDPLSEDKAKCTFNIFLKKAIIYAYGRKRVPKDYYLHEVLHCAVGALRSLDRRYRKQIRTAEEEFVQDVCYVWRKYVK